MKRWPKVQPPADFLPRVVRTADRWRALDADSDGASQAAARVLQTLGQRELAWDYLTTPLARKPSESGPWWALAQQLVKQGEGAIAEEAFRAAFDSEPTNAEILWQRAENLQRAGKAVEAQKLFRQIAEGPGSRASATFRPRPAGSSAGGRLEFGPVHWSAVLHPR